MTDFALIITTRRNALRLCFAAPVLGGLSLLPDAARADEVLKKFDFLKENGNSNCSQDFLDSIQTMPDGARLQGSCCGPMALHRYREQVAGLNAYAALGDVHPILTTSGPASRSASLPLTTCRSRPSCKRPMTRR